MKIKNPLRSLTAFEKGLWLVSVVVVTGSFLLCSDDYLTLIASLIGVTALIFLAKGMIAGQLLTVLFAVFYGIISFFFRYYGEMITYLCMSAPMAALSILSWLRHPFEDTETSGQVEISRVTRRQLCILLPLTAAVTTAFYFILRALGTANLWFSTVSVATSFFASALTFLRSPYYAVAYAVNDLVLIVLWTLAAIVNRGYVPMVLCFVMFLVNDSYGFWSWRNTQKRQESAAQAQGKGNE